MRRTCGEDPIIKRVVCCALLCALGLFLLSGCRVGTAAETPPDVTLAPTLEPPTPTPPGEDPPLATDPGQQQETDKLEALGLQLQAGLDGLSGRWELRVEVLNGNGGTCTAGSGEQNGPMVSASLIKLFVMGAVYERIEQGALSETELRDSLNKMIAVSDNASANALIRLLGDGDAAAGMDAVNAWAASVDCGDVRLNRLMLEDNGLENYVSARSCALLLGLIYRGECVSAAASGSMLALLKEQTVNDRIPQGLPTGTVCAHKTGNLAGLCVADVGVVYAPGTDYIFCAICNDPSGDAEATAAIAELSRTVYDYFAATGR